MKKKLLISLLIIVSGVCLFVGCNLGDRSIDGRNSKNPSAAEQDLLNLCDLYIKCNDYSSANTLVETSYTNKSFFKKSKTTLEEQEEHCQEYVSIMKQAKSILDQLSSPEDDVSLYSQLNTLQSSSRFSDFLDYLGPGGNFVYVPHSQIASGVSEFDSTKANGIGLQTGTNCDCIYWYIGSFYGATKNEGILVHTDGIDTVVITGLDYELVRTVSDRDKYTTYTEFYKDKHEIEDTVEQPAVKESVDFVMEERVSNGTIKEYFFKNGIHTGQITGTIKNGVFEGDVLFTEYADGITYKGTAFAHNGIFERLTDAVPNTVFDTDKNQYVCAAMYDSSGNLHSLKLSPTQGIAQMHHYSVCPKKYLVYSTGNTGTITAFPFMKYMGLYHIIADFTTATDYNVLYTFDGPVSLLEYSNVTFNSLTLYTEKRTRYLSAKILGPSFILDSDKMINLPKETIIAWLDDNTTYIPDSYFSTFESAPVSKESTFYVTKDGTDMFTVKHPTIGKTILKATTTDVTGIVYDGYIVFMENYQTGIRYQFSYMVERSLFDEKRDLEIAQSITLIGN